MLKTRIIPTLLWKNYTLVKGIGFDSWRRVGTIIPAIKVYNTRQVDELIIVDIEATKEQREPDYETVAEFSAECFMPLTVGGGITELPHIRKLLMAGADKICINSASYSNPGLITDAANSFGSQCIVVSIDVRRIENKHICFSHNGSIDTGLEVTQWAKEIEKLGAGEILLTSIECDGTMKGYDIDLIKKVTGSVNIPVIAQGGAGNYEDMYLALTQGKAQAVSAASMFHFTESTPLEAKKYLASKNIPVRKMKFE